jgi:subtilisin-like proprotein convertase family protein
MNRALIMSGLVGLGALTILVGIYAERSHPGAVLAAPLLFGAGSVIVPACMGKRWALKICLFTLIVVGFMSFRHRDATDLSVDTSIIYRLAVCSAVFVIGLANLPAGVRHFQNVPYLGLAAYVFLAAGSAIYSLTPTYTLGCAYGYLCMLVFMPAVVARLGIKESLRVAMLAVGTHVLIAVILWFVAPDSYAAMNAAITDNGYNGTLASMTCVNLVATAADCANIITAVTVTADISHTWLGDLTIKLVSPDATVVTLLSLAGRGETTDDGQFTSSRAADLVAGYPITFATGAPTSAEDMGATLNGLGVVCKDDALCTFAPNAGAATPGTLTTFNGKVASGTWKFCAGDSGAADFGVINKVTLNISR